MLSRLLARRGVTLVALLSLVAAEPATREAPLQPGDLVRVTVNQLAGPNVPSDFLERVDADGWIALPLVGKLKVGKLSRAEAARAVERPRRLGGGNARYLPRRDVGLPRPLPQHPARRAARRARGQARRRADRRRRAAREI